MRVLTFPRVYCIDSHLQHLKLCTHGCKMLQYCQKNLLKISCNRENTQFCSAKIVRKNIVRPLSYNKLLDILQSCEHSSLPLSAHCRQIFYCKMYKINASADENIVIQIRWSQQVATSKFLIHIWGLQITHLQIYHKNLNFYLKNIMDNMHSCSRVLNGYKYAYVDSLQF